VRRTVFVTEEDDPTLVERCRAGERNAFERLVVRYQKPVFNVALRMLRNRQDAMDVAQTTFLKAFEHLGDYDPSFRFYSWLYRIAINESLNALALRKPRGELDGNAADETPGPDRAAEGDQALRAIEEALMRISPELRAVVVLRHIAQQSYQDMAEALGLPEKTVKSRLHSARERLREHLLRSGAI
jgi:RNA polymerase sigma-70 factor (ECF subfamily)